MDLPANATRTFRLMAGRGPQALDGVKVDESHPDYIEIVNGLTGVRVPISNRPGPDAGITLETNLRGGDNALFLDTSKRTIRFAWGIYAGTRADAPDKLPAATAATTASR